MMSLPERLSTNLGLTSLLVLPVPSYPLEPSPQVNTSPAVLIAIVWYSPVHIYIILPTVALLSRKGLR